MLNRGRMITVYASRPVVLEDGRCDLFRREQVRKRGRLKYATGFTQFVQIQTLSLPLADRESAVGDSPAQSNHSLKHLW